MKEKEESLKIFLPFSAKVLVTTTLQADGRKFNMWDA